MTAIGRSRKLGPRVTVSVTPGDYDTLNALAEKDDVSISWVVRRAIQEYLRRHRRPPPTDPRHRAAIEARASERV